MDVLNNYYNVISLLLYNYYVKDNPNNVKATLCGLIIFSRKNKRLNMQKNRADRIKLMRQFNPLFRP